MDFYNLHIITRAKKKLKAEWVHIQKTKTNLKLETSTIITKMYTLIQLSQSTKRELQSICIDYGIKSSGNMSDLIPRIRFHQEKIQKEEEAKKQLLANGAKPRCVEFEQIIRAFELWCSKEGFAPFKGYITTEKVDINEIRAAFANYNDNETNPQLSEFFYMLFNVHDNWEFYDTTEQDREFDCDSEYNSNWLVAGMTEIYEEMEREEMNSPQEEQKVKKRLPYDAEYDRDGEIVHPEYGTFW